MGYDQGRIKEIWGPRHFVSLGPLSHIKYVIKYNCSTSFFYLSKVSLSEYMFILHITCLHRIQLENP